jgi:hypothetical protein
MRTVNYLFGSCPFDAINQSDGDEASGSLVSFACYYWNIEVEVSEMAVMRRDCRNNCVLSNRISYYVCTFDDVSSSVTK